MKRLLTILAIFLCLSLLWAGCALADTSVPVKIQRYNNGEDSQSHGYIEQTAVALAAGEPVQIVMDEVFDMYPAHNGIYGVLLATGNVTLTGGEGQSVSGTGTLEFSFPGATGCTLSGTGKVYAYFLPVPYMRLSSSVSLIEQAFDTSFLTQTAVGHQNMFILTDPHLFIYQENIPMTGTVYKYNTNLGPIPSAYAQFAPNEICDCYFPFLYNTPILVQCDAVTLEAYLRDTYFARPMKKAASGNGYEVWTYSDYQPQSDVYQTLGNTVNACLSLAKEQFLGDGRSVDTILMVMLREEISRMGYAGVAISEAMPHQIGFMNYIYYDTESMEDITDYDVFLCAHEIGHIVQSAALTTNNISCYSWFMEGFADYFGEKVCRRMGNNYRLNPTLGYHDTQALSYFDQDLVFGVTGWNEYEIAWRSGKGLLEPYHSYNFGHLFMKYLEDTYGEGFYKNISNSFYQQFYQGHEKNFFYRLNDLNYNVDRFFALVKGGLDENAYLAYPAYARTHYADRIATNILRLPEDLTEIGEEAFANLTDATIYIVLPEGISSIADNAFENSNIVLVCQNDYALDYAKQKWIPYTRP